MTDDGVDYEDLTEMTLDDDELATMLSQSGECVFNWTTRDGYPVGVVVGFVHRDGKFFTTCAEKRKRVSALRSRPPSSIVINKNGKAATFKGESTVHAPGDPGFDDLKAWFYPALSGLDLDPDNEYRKSFTEFLDSPHRVIVETDARLVVAFDGAKFRSFTIAAMAASSED